MADGLRRMYGETPEDIIYYLTVYNEPIPQPAEPENADVEGILRGMYLLSPSGASATDPRPQAQILASGIAVPWALQAQQLLREDWGVAANVWSVTSWSQLRRDGLDCDRSAFLAPDGPVREPYLTQRLAQVPGPVLAVSDYMRQVPDQIRQWVPQDYTSLGTDGYGFSDTRPAARRFFAVDGPSITAQVLRQLARAGAVSPRTPRDAVQQYRLHDVTAGTPSTTWGDT
jgi:pyruvate dehydrogenase E1 component